MHYCLYNLSKWNAQRRWCMLLATSTTSNSCMSWIHTSVFFSSSSGCSFVHKAQQVEEAGGKAVLIADNVVENDSLYLDMVADGSTAMPSIPALFLLGRDGWDRYNITHEYLFKRRYSQWPYWFSWVGKALETMTMQCIIFSSALHAPTLAHKMHFNCIVMVSSKIVEGLPT